MHPARHCAYLDHYIVAIQRVTAASRVAVMSELCSSEPVIASYSSRLRFPSSDPYELSLDATLVLVPMSLTTKTPEISNSSIISCATRKDLGLKQLASS